MPIQPAIAEQELAFEALFHDYFDSNRENFKPHQPVCLTLLLCRDYALFIVLQLRFNETDNLSFAPVVIIVRHCLPIGNYAERCINLWHTARLVPPLDIALIV
ncbi:hypothetical protein SAMD00079811_33220 [Scytonema sp. HK-05]|nr:hypothetical protein SAMD00079811_33220 [Scytonema sp. HK-05]